MCTWYPTTTGASGVSGSGTTGRIPQWSSSTALGDSTLIKTGTGIVTLNVDTTQTWKALGDDVFVGLNAGQYATGNNLVLIGSNAGQNAGGDNCAAIGRDAGIYNSTGSNWYALGSFAGANSTSGSRWVAIGSTAGNGNQDGNDWLALGYSAGFSNRHGSAWVALGSGAGYSNDGSRCVFLGTNAGYYETGSDKLYIEPSTSTRPLIYGDFAADTLTFYATDAATSAVRTQLTLDYSSSGTPAAGFGSRLLWNLTSSTTVSRNAADWSALWATATDATRAARIVGTIYDTAAREWIRGESNGSAPMLGVLGAAASAQITLPAAATDAATTQALANALRSALITFGFCT